MRVLVTGALGNLGFATVRELLNQRHDVVCFDLDLPQNRRRARKLGRRATIIWGDITDAEACRAALDGIDAVVHNAAVLPPGTERAPDRARAVNVDGTLNLIRTIEDDGIQRPFVYSSSISVFGPESATREPVTSESPVRATDNYTEHKLTCEKLLRESSLPWVILRVGVAMDTNAGTPDPVVLRMMFDVNPDNPMEVVSSRDVALAQANAISTPAARHKILLIGGGKACRIRHRDLWNSLFKLLQIKEFPNGAFGRRPYYTCWMDTRESQNLLEFQRSNFADIQGELAAKIRYAKPLLRMLSPLTKRYLLRYSSAWSGDSPRAGR